jgi:hypothetical protein
MTSEALNTVAKVSNALAWAAVFQAVLLLVIWGAKGILLTTLLSCTIGLMFGLSVIALVAKGLAK